jgi:hypothetical protein
MANRRMISKKLAWSNKFLNLSVEAQALYFHLCLRADDDGFLNNTITTARLCEIPTKAVNELIKKGFLIRFENYVFCIVHWRVNNGKIRSDRYKPTVYQEYYSRLISKPGEPYKLKQLIKR